MKVLLGITGCIAAYKAPELLRQLQKRGCDIHVVMTENAQNFVTATTLAALSGNHVFTGMFLDPDSGSGLDVAIDHIRLAHSADLLLVAPATANTLAKFANGIADDFLSTLYLATRVPVVVAPAMNTDMWRHPAVQANLRQLASLGVNIVEPEEGYLAEGITGKGRLAALETIVERALQAGAPPQDLQGDTVLVTAGPTCEDIDPVRYLTNRSSGKMGYQLAHAAQRRGARTILVSGPTKLDPPSGVEFIAVRSTEQMREQVLKHLAEASIVIKAAAVSDFRPRAKSGQKIKRDGQSLVLELVPNPDILKEVGTKKEGRILVGFAAETQSLLQNGEKKLKEKSLDLLVANDVSQAGAGFDGDTNIVTILTRDGHQLQLDKRPKAEVAHEILNQILAFRKRHA
jgi:phosphopantothenoylcysteine decarboxylase / phosphopantothenate---cysteine ligase